MTNSITEQSESWKNKPWKIIEKKQESISLMKKVQGLTLWILLSLWVYTWTKEIIQHHEYWDFIKTEETSYKIFEQKFSEYYKKKYDFFQKTWYIITKMIDEHLQSGNKEELLKDLSYIIHSSEDSIREIILTDLQGNIQFDINTTPNWEIWICENYWKIEDNYFFSLSELLKFPTSKSYISGVHSRFSLCWKTNENPSVDAVRRIHTENGLDGFLIIKYKISFLQEFFSQNTMFFENSQISITNNFSEILYQHKTNLNSKHKYNDTKLISVRQEPYRIDFLADEDIRKHTVESNLFGWWIWMIFFRLYLWFLSYHVKSKEELLLLLKKKSFEIWNTKLKIGEYAKILEDILESSPYPIFLQDSNWRYILWNTLFANFAWLESSNQFSSSPVTVSDISLSIEEMNLHNKMDWKLLIDGILEPYEFSRKNPDWSISHYRVKKWLFKKEEGEIRWIIWIFIDITDLKQATEKAESESKAKSDFLTNMSHELRTPLNAIIWFSQILKDELFGSIWPKYQWYSVNIHSAGEHLLQLIEDILDLSKIEHWSSSLNKTECYLQTIVDQSINFVKGKCDQKNITITTDIPSSLFLYVDKLKLKQVLINLLSNSMKFTASWWTISITAMMVEDATVKIEIQDNWIGMDKNELERILEPFYQIDTAYNRKNSWIWLWLSLTNKIICAHKWLFTIESEKWKGTKAIILLPSIEDEKTLEEMLAQLN